MKAKILLACLWAALAVACSDGSGKEQGQPEKFQLQGSEAQPLHLLTPPESSGVRNGIHYGIGQPPPPKSTVLPNPAQECGEKYTAGSYEFMECACTGMWELCKNKNCTGKLSFNGLDGKKYPCVDGLLLREQ